MFNFKVGDKVKILRAWEDRAEYPGWISKMNETIGQTAIIVKLELDYAHKPKAYLSNGWWYKCEVLQRVHQQLYLFNPGYD